MIVEESKLTFTLIDDLLENKIVSIIIMGGDVYHEFLSKVLTQVSYTQPETEELKVKRPTYQGIPIVVDHRNPHVLEIY